MATLVLTTVGTVLGGPVGGALGAVIGNQVDQRWLAPRRQGARLGALTVQTSAYGQPIPKLFGTLRVAGTVIWATDLKEDRHKSGGKGAPKTTSYSYSASFAVALSARPILEVRRIWADGKLLRGAAGDWKSETIFRMYPGDESQAVDPLLAAVEAAGGTPAYRGLAYAVFEDMQLADFGNRIPSLTFEVVADSAPVSLGTIADTLSGGVAGGETQGMLDGYAAGGDSVRGALEALARAIPFTLRDTGSRLVLVDTPGAGHEIASTDLGSDEGGRCEERLVIERRSAGTLPDEVTVTYYEPGRDYQAGLQRARRGGPGRRVEAIELPAVLGAGAAKAAAERRLAEGWADRTTATVRLPWRWLALRPGDAVSLPAAGAWRVGHLTLEKMVLTLTLRNTAAAGGPLPTARAGRAAAAEDAVHGPTRIALLDLPPLDDAASRPQLWLAAAGVSSGWRRATVTVSVDEGASWRSAGVTALPATMGQAVTVLPPGDPALFDRITSVEVDLLNDAMTLVSCSDDALVSGSNAAMLGEELIQFGEASQLSPTRWRLSRLLRGLRGSEAMMVAHRTGEPFVLVERESLLPIDVPAGADTSLIVSGLGDTTGVTTTRVAGVRALRPPSPVHLRAVSRDAGLSIGWTRRSRIGWAWNDGGDVAIGEDRERYNLTITPYRGSTRIVEVDGTGFHYSAAMIAVDNEARGGTVLVEVRQLGSFGASAPATASFGLEGDGM